MTEISDKDVPNGKPASRIWTLEAWTIHTEALRQADKELEEERDRRYAEVNIEKEKALKIKEEADKEAMRLAREIQVYKEAQADTATRATSDYVASQVGAKGQAFESRQQGNANTGVFVALAVAAATIFLSLIAIGVSVAIALSSGP